MSVVLSPLSSPTSGQHHNSNGNGVSVDFDKLTDQSEISEFIKEHNQELRFPEKLMLLMGYIETHCRESGDNPDKACISWTADGHALILRDHNKLVNYILPQVFQTRGRFASFTRKLYRWGFRRKITKATKGSTPPTNIKIFFHKHFQRDNKELLAQMTSIVAQRGAGKMPPAVKEKHDCNVESSIPQSQSQLALSQLMSAASPMLDTLARQQLQQYHAALAKPGFCLSPLIVTNFLAGNRGFTGRVPSMLEVLSMRRAMLAAVTSPPSLFHAWELFQHDKTFHAMKRNQVQDFITNRVWQSLPSTTQQNLPRNKSMCFDVYRGVNENSATPLSYHIHGKQAASSGYEKLQI